MSICGLPGSGMTLAVAGAMKSTIHRLLDDARLVLGFVALTFANAGCATVLKGSTSSMKIAGLPEDAVVETADGIPVTRKPPLTRKAKPTDSVLVSVTDPPRVLRVTSSGGSTQVPAKRFVGAGWIVLGLLTGVVPLIVDAATGSWYEYEDTSMAAGRSVANPSSAK